MRTHVYPLSKVTPVSGDPGHQTNHAYTMSKIIGLWKILHPRYAR